MTEPSNHTIGTRLGQPRRGGGLSLALLVCGALMLAGCAHVTRQEQRLVAKPNMQFSGSEIFGFQNRLLTQFESSSVSSVGGQSSGASCACGD